jgi:holo-[acyl-carrier protein] synthase
VSTTGIGIDVIEIERIERALERRPRLAERLFTAAELGYARRHGRPGRQLAARFAAKEAVIKALGTSSAVPASAIEVVAGEPPTVALTGRAAEVAGGREVLLSLTHSRETAAAVALVQPAG